MAEVFKLNVWLPLTSHMKRDTISSRVFITYAHIRKESNSTFRLLSLLSITVTLLFIGTGQIDSPVYTHSDSVPDGQCVCFL